MLLFENKQDKVEILDDHIATIEKVVEHCVKDFSKKCNHKIAVSVIIVDNEEMRLINMQNRNIDRPTDVLSFPMFEIDPFSEEFPEMELDLDTGYVLLGDIAVSAELTHQQAQEYGHSFHREIGFLISHGVFHMLGYDHESPEDEKRMMSLQEEVLSLLGLIR